MAAIKKRLLSPKWINLEFPCPELRVPMMKISIDGNELYFILDTGAERCIIDKSVADKIGIVPNGKTISVEGISNDQVTGIDTCSVFVEIAGVNEYTLNAAIMDIDVVTKYGQEFGIPVAGILSNNFIVRNALVIDYYNMRVLVR